MSELKEGEYIHVEIPRWYWIIIWTLLGIAGVVFITSAILTVGLGLPWFLWDGRQTPFGLGATIVYLLALVDSGVLIVGLCIFPKSIRSKQK